MSNVLKGRTYTDYTWDVPQGAQQYFDTRLGSWRYREEDVTEIKSPYVVHNGMWVMERPWYGHSWLVGVERDMLKVHEYTDKRNMSHQLSICDKPFGFVVVDHDDMDESVYPFVPVGPKNLVCAQQIHKGELGQSVPLIGGIEYVRANDKRRGNGWVRLTDLADAANLPVKDVVFGYWEYSHHRNYRYYQNDQDGGMLLDIVIATTKDDIKGQVPDVISLTQDAATELLDAVSGKCVWVRKGFAYTILRLLTLGVQPSVTQSV